MTAYASSVGGIATPIGTTTNVVAMGFFREDEYLRPFDRFRPLVAGRRADDAAVGAGLVVVAAVAGAARPARSLGRAAHLQAERAKLGPWSAGERNTLVVFLAVVTLWILPSLLLLAGLDEASAWLSRHFPEEIVALAAPVLLFLLPVDWRRRRFSLDASDFAKIDWSTLLLFGSGLALGDLMFKTGPGARHRPERLRRAGDRRRVGDHGRGHRRRDPAERIHEQRHHRDRPDPGRVVDLPGRATSSRPPPLMGVTFGASFGSALPVSTPPNAIVYGSGLVPSRRMILAGVGFDIACGVVIWSVLRVAYALGWTPLGAG